MELFGGDFDDDLFGETKKKGNKQQQEYCAKQYEPLWFNEKSSTGTSEDRRQIESRGNWFFRRGQYDLALNEYQKVTKLYMAPNRDVMEAIIRCHAKLGDEVQALEQLSKCEDEVKNVDSMCNYLNLAVFVFSKLHMLESVILALKKLCLLRSAEPTLWCSLAEQYKTILAQLMEKDSYDDYTSGCGTVNEMEASVSALALRKGKPSGQSTKVENPENSGKPDRCESDMNSENDNGTHVMNGMLNVDITSCQTCVCRRNVICDQNYDRDQNNEKLTNTETSPLHSREECVRRLKYAQLTCLCRASFLIRAVERNLRSFAVDKHANMQAKIKQDIEQISLAPEIITACEQNLAQYAEGRESEGERNEKKILQSLTRVNEAFDRRWFSWII